MCGAQLEALAVETRRRIYDLIAARSRSVQELADALPVSRPAVSQHLKVLVRAGLAKASVVGTRRLYSADPAGLVALRQWADQMWNDVIGGFADFAETSKKEEEMLDEGTRIEPVVKTLRMRISAAQAFLKFTQEIASWWPLARHSVGQKDAASVRFEPGEGGRIVETTRDGTQHEWGKVVAWEPGKRVEFSWHPGQTEAQQTWVELKFRDTAGGCEMILIHSGWEARGDRALENRNDYDRGWDFVLACYSAAS